MKPAWSGTPREKPEMLELAAPAIHGTLQGMSLPPPPVAPEKLRPLLHEKVDQLHEDDLAAAHETLRQLELKRLVGELGSDLAEARASGRMTEESIEAARLEHRRKHPYR
jgi:hypothetical protein